MNELAAELVSLTPAQIEAFERDGFVRLQPAFLREVAERCPRA